MSKNTSEIITCKAAVCWGAGLPMKVEEIQVEAPKWREVRIKMLCASLCHTDILCCKGIPIPLFPRVPGHEGVGMIESVGEGVKEVKEGDIVIPTYIGECGKCENCESGKSNLCLEYPLHFDGLMPDGSSRMTLINGQKLYHLFSCSTWCEYSVIHVNYVLKVDPCWISVLPHAHASFLSCGFSTGFGSTWKEAKVHKGSSVAVLGLGAVGLGVVEGARIHGAAKIIGVDLNENRRSKGEAFGMTDFINPTTTNSDTSIADSIKELTGGNGVDYCFECTRAAPLVNQALEATKLGIGTSILIGAGLEQTGIINFVPLLCGRTLKGSIFGGLKTQSDLPIIFDKWINKDFRLDELLTHEVSLDEINKAFELLKQPDCVKVVIKI